MNKKGEGEDTLKKLLIAAVLIIIVVVLIRMYVSKPASTLNKYQMEQKCLEFYRQIGESNLLANTCNSVDDCTQDGKDYCCDMIPDDKIREGDEKFFGCCISSSQEIKSKCPGVIAAASPTSSQP